MILKNLNEIFPDIEILVFDSKSDKSYSDSYPKGEYKIEEYYCSDIDCDCRKVRLVITGSDDKKCVLDYGWDTKEFYMNFLGDEKMAEELAGLSIDTWNIQPKYVDSIFNKINKDLNKGLSERFKKNYMLIKAYYEKLEDTCECGNDHSLDTNDGKTWLDEYNTRVKKFKKELSKSIPKKKVKLIISKFKEHNPNIINDSLDINNIILKCFDKKLPDNIDYIFYRLYNIYKFTLDIVDYIADGKDDFFSEDKNKKEYHNFLILFIDMYVVGLSYFMLRKINIGIIDFHFLDLEKQKIEVESFFSKLNSKLKYDIIEGLNIYEDEITDKILNYLAAD